MKDLLNAMSFIKEACLIKKNRGILSNTRFLQFILWQEHLSQNFEMVSFKTISNCFVIHLFHLVDSKSQQLYSFVFSQSAPKIANVGMYVCLYVTNQRTFFPPKYQKSATTSSTITHHSMQNIPLHQA